MKKFEQELATLRTRIVDMGTLSRSMIEMAIGALDSPGDDVYQKVLAAEEQLDQMQLDIDREAIRLLTVYGPVANDLRFVLMVARINSELERIGDQAVNICEDLQLMAAKTKASPPPEIHKMAKLVSGMVRDSMAAFVQEDVRKADEVLATDDVVDALNDQVVRELLSDQVVREAISADEGPAHIADALGLILLSRSLERIADQATNICEEVIYMVKGADVRHKHV
ncbi:MAG: phosphate signaling complex protein PhoU [Pirellulales bacterium]